MLSEMKHVHTVWRRLADGTRVAYHYAWRGKGAPAIRHDPNSAEFRAAYDAAHASRNGGANDPVNNISALILQCVDWTEFVELKPRSRANCDRWLRRIDAEFGQLGLKFFSPANEAILRGMFLSWRDKYAKTSLSAADKGWMTLKKLILSAKHRGKIFCNPCTEVSQLYESDRAHILWSPEDEKRFLRYAPEQFILPFLLALYSGQRGGDLVIMQFSKRDIGMPRYDGAHMYLRTQKTNTFIKVRAIQPLKKLLDAEMKRSKGAGYVLKSSLGTPWGDFSASFSHMKKDLGFDVLHFHDLRGSAVSRLDDAGVAIGDIAAVTGHSEKNAEAILNSHYRGPRTKAAERAMAALEKNAPKLSTRRAPAKKRRAPAKATTVKRAVKRAVR